MANKPWVGPDGKPRIGSGGKPMVGGAGKNCCCTDVTLLGDCRWCTAGEVPNGFNVTLPTVKTYKAIADGMGGWTQGDLVCTFPGGTYLCNNFFDYTTAYDAIIERWHTDHPDDVDPIFGQPQSTIYDPYALYKGCYWFGPVVDCCLYINDAEVITAVGMQPVAFIEYGSGQLNIFWLTVWDNNGDGPDEFFWYDEYSAAWPGLPTPPANIWFPQQAAASVIAATSWSSGELPYPDCSSINKTRAAAATAWDTGSPGAIDSNGCANWDGFYKFTNDAGTFAVVTA
jgi:hypothetical protein